MVRHKILSALMAGAMALSLAPAVFAEGDALPVLPPAGAAVTAPAPAGEEPGETCAPAAGAEPAEPARALTTETEPAEPAAEAEAPEAAQPAEEAGAQGGRQEAGFDLAQAVAEALPGDTVTLPGDVTLGDFLILDKPLTLDMAGHTLTYTAAHKQSRGGLLDVKSGGRLTITGDGLFTYDESYAASDSSLGYILRLGGDGSLVVESGTFHAGLTCIQAQDSARAEILGGRFRADFSWGGTYWLLNLVDGSPAQILVRGGEFEHFDPEHSRTENPEANFLAEGAVCQKEGEVYRVHTHDRAKVLPGQKATCRSAGLTEGRACSVCGQVMEEQRQIPVGGHRYDAGGRCQLCGEQLKVEAPALDSQTPGGQLQVGVADQSGVTGAVVGLLESLEGESETPQGISEQTAQQLKELLDRDPAQAQKVSASIRVDIGYRPTGQEQARMEAAAGEGALAQYLGLTVMLRVEDRDLGAIRQLDRPIQVSLAIPAEWEREGREFFVVRLHEGEAQVLPAARGEDGTLTFFTDRFSAYALGYRDPAPEEKPAPGGPGDSGSGQQGGGTENPGSGGQSGGGSTEHPVPALPLSGSPAAPVSVRAPQTGDPARLGPWALALALSALALAAAGRFGKSQKPER